MSTDNMKIKNGNSALFYAVLIATTFIIQGAPTQVSPHIATFAELFSDKSLSTVMYLATVPNLVCIFASFIVGFLVKKIGMRPTLIMGAAFFVIGGFLPLLAGHNFGYLILCRFIAGWGYGILYSLAVTLVVTVYKEGQFRQTMMGVGTAFQLVGVIGFSFITGALVKHFADVNGLWWATFMMVPCLILSFFAKLPKAVGKEIEDAIIENEDARTAERKAVKAGEAEKEKLNGYAIFYVATMFIIGLVLNEIFIYISNIVVDNGMGSTMDVAGIVSAHAIAAAIASFAYGLLYKLFKKRGTLVLSTIISVVGNIIMGTCTTIIGMYIGACVFHIGFGWMFSAYMMLLAQVCPPKKIAMLNGWSVAMMNLGGFLTGNVMIWLTKLLGHENDLQFAMLIGAAIFVALTIAYIIVRPKIDYTKMETVES